MLRSEREDILCWTYFPFYSAWKRRINDEFKMKISLFQFILVGLRKFSSNDVSAPWKDRDIELESELESRSCMRALTKFTSVPGDMSYVDHVKCPSVIMSCYSKWMAFLLINRDNRVIDEEKLLNILTYANIKVFFFFSKFI